MIGELVGSDVLLCDDDAFHPRMNRAVVVVCARSGKGEGVCLAVPDIGRSKCWQATVLSCVGSYGMVDRAIVLPNHATSVHCCVVGRWAEQAASIVRAARGIILYVDVRSCRGWR